MSITEVNVTIMSEAASCYGEWLRKVIMTKAHRFCFQRN